MGGGPGINCAKVVATTWRKTPSHELASSARQNSAEPASHRQLASALRLLCPYALTSSSTSGSGFAEPTRRTRSRWEGTYLQQLDRQEALLSEEVPRALEGLEARQRREVAALVFTLTVELEEHSKWKVAPKEIEKQRRDVLRLERRLQKNLGKLDKIIDERLAMVRVDPRIVREARASSPANKWKILVGSAGLEPATSCL